MTIFASSLRLFLLGAVAVFAFADGAAAQVAWLKDASNARVPAGFVAGQIDGKAVSELKFGHLSKSGTVDFGAPDRSFVQYTLHLQDAEQFFEAKAFAELTVTVRKGQIPDGKTFLRTSADWKEQPGPRGEGYWVPEFHFLSMTAKKSSMREQGQVSTGQDARLASGADSPFTGLIAFDRRKGQMITARLYVCFADIAKSCLAGTAEVEIR
jgi:hypothetical protein